MAIFNGRYQSPRKTDGTVNSAGKLYFFETGTSTLKAVFTDENLTTEHTNPIILDSNGSALVFLGNGSYDYRVDDSADAAIVTTSGPITANADINNITISPNLIVNGDFTGYNSGTGDPDSWIINQGPANVTVESGQWSGNTVLTLTANAGETAEVSSSVVTLSPYRDYLFLVECDTSGTVYDFSVGIGESSDNNVWALDSLDLNNRVYARTFSTGITEIAAGRVWITLSSTSGLATANIGSIKMIDITGQSRVPSLSNLLITNNATNPDSQIDITADSIDLLANNDYPVKFRNVSITADITTDLFSGTEANDTWYKVYLTYTGGNVGVYLVADTSTLFTTGPIYQRLVGYVYNDSSGDFRRFTQIDDWYKYHSDSTVFAQADVDTTWTTVDLAVPDGVRVVDLVFFSYGSGAGSAAFLQYRITSTTANNILASIGSEIAMNQARIFSDENGEIEIRHNVSGAQLALVSLSGFQVSLTK